MAFFDLRYRNQQGNGGSIAIGSGKVAVLVHTDEMGNTYEFFFDDHGKLTDISWIPSSNGNAGANKAASRVNFGDMAKKFIEIDKIKNTLDTIDVDNLVRQADIEDRYVQHTDMDSTYSHNMEVLRELVSKIDISKVKNGKKIDLTELAKNSDVSKQYARKEALDQLTNKIDVSKIPASVKIDLSKLATKTDIDTLKINYIQDCVRIANRLDVDGIRDKIKLSDLATKGELSDVKNLADKIDVSGVTSKVKLNELVKKTDLSNYTKTSDLDSKYAKANDVIKLATKDEIKAAKDLASKVDVSNITGNKKVALDKLDALLDKVDVSGVTSKVKLNELAKKTDLGNYTKTSDLDSKYAKTNDVIKFATKDEIQAAKDLASKVDVSNMTGNKKVALDKLGTIAEKLDMQGVAGSIKLNDLAKRAELGRQEAIISKIDVSKVAEGRKIDLSELVKHSDVESVYMKKTALSEYAKTSDLDNITAKINIDGMEGKEIKLSDLVTKGELSDVKNIADKIDVNGVTSKIKLNELVHKAELSEYAKTNDLNNKYAQKTELNKLTSKIDTYGVTEKINLGKLATSLKNITDKINVNNVQNGITIDLNELAMKTSDLDGKYARKDELGQYAKMSGLDNKYAQKTELSKLTDKIDISKVPGGKKVDLSELVKHSDVESVYMKKTALKEYAKTSDLDNITAKINIDGMEGKEIKLSDLVTKGELLDVKNIADKLDVSGLASKIRLNELVSKADVDSQYAKKGALSQYTKTSDLNNQYAQKTELNKLTDKIDVSKVPNGKAVDLSELADKKDIENQYAKKDDLGQYTKTSDLDSKYAKTNDVIKFATKDEIQAAKDLAGKVDISNMAGNKKVALDKLGTLLDKLDTTEVRDSIKLNDLAKRTELNGYAKTSDLDSKYAKAAELHDYVKTGDLNDQYAKKDSLTLLANELNTLAGKIDTSTVMDRMRRTIGKNTELSSEDESLNSRIEDVESKISIIEKKAPFLTTYGDLDSDDGIPDYYASWF